MKDLKYNIENMKRSAKIYQKTRGAQNKNSIFFKKTK